MIAVVAAIEEQVAGRPAYSQATCCKPDLRLMKNSRKSCLLVLNTSSIKEAVSSMKVSREGICLVSAWVLLLPTIFLSSQTAISSDHFPTRRSRIHCAYDHGPQRYTHSKDHSDHDESRPELALVIERCLRSLSRSSVSSVAPLILNGLRAVDRLRIEVMSLGELWFRTPSLCAAA